MTKTKRAAGLWGCSVTQQGLASVANDVFNKAGRKLVPSILLLLHTPEFLDHWTVETFLDVPDYFDMGQVLSSVLERVSIYLLRPISGMGFAANA